MKTYAISDGEFVKVGRSGNVNRRLSMLQMGNARTLIVLGLIDGDHEQTTHRKLINAGIARGSGEWFDLNKQSRSLLASIGFTAPSVGPSRCESCDEILPPTKPRGRSFSGRPRAYCDDACRARASRRRRATPRTATGPA